MIKDWNDLRYLWALNEGGTMRRAAQMLGTSPTTVSRHIKKLAEELGQLLAVQTKGEDWALTPQGRELVDLAAEINRKVSDVNDIALSNHTTNISITSLDFVLTYFLAPRLRDILLQEPSLRITLCGSDRRLSLAFNEVDLALRFGRPEEGQLIAKKLCSIEMRVWQPTYGPTQNWVGMTEDLDWTPDMKLARTVFGRGPTVRASSYAAAKRIAVSLGYATIGPDAVMGSCKNLTPTAGETVSREIWSVIHESRRLDNNLAAVKDWIDNLFRVPARKASVR